MGPHRLCNLGWSGFTGYRNPNFFAWVTVHGRGEVHLGLCTTPSKLNSGTVFQATFKGMASGRVSVVTASQAQIPAMVMETSAGGSSNVPWPWPWHCSSTVGLNMVNLMVWRLGHSVMLVLPRMYCWQCWAARLIWNICGDNDFMHIIHWYHLHRRETHLHDTIEIHYWSTPPYTQQTADAAALPYGMTFLLSECCEMLLSRNATKRQMRTSGTPRLSPAGYSSTEVYPNEAGGPTIVPGANEPVFSTALPYLANDDIPKGTL